jgi:hypothetical protein
MSVVGRSENWGSEQEHLNNVFGARLRITTLRAAGPGPAIELLEYLAPVTGRPYPADARVCDMLHWEVTVRVDDVRLAEAAMRAGRAPFVSSGIVELARAAGIVVRDPDGHAVHLEASSTSGATAASRLHPD